MSSFSLFRARLYDGIRTEDTRVNAEAATFRQERGEIIITLYIASIEFLWLDPISGVEIISLLVCGLHDVLHGM